MGFFLDVFGFNEETGKGYSQTQKNLLDKATFQTISTKDESYFRERCDFKVSDDKYVSAGIFSMPSVKELRQHAQCLKDKNEGRGESCKISVKNIVGEARSLHTTNAGSNKSKSTVIVQAASQFNFLEFPSPDCNPEHGISSYIFDRTQGPACAIACAAGTAYRNYLVPVPFNLKQRAERGQTRNNQLNGLSDVEEYLFREKGIRPWKVKNGYFEATRENLTIFNDLLRRDESMREKILCELRIALQENTAVTDDLDFNTQVTQTYNSALSIAYSQLWDKSLWQPLSQIVLDATYEATLLAAVVQSYETKRTPIVYLTKVGGGAFGNESIWIRQAIGRAIQAVEGYNISLDIRIVHFRSIEPEFIVLERKK